MSYKLKVAAIENFSNSESSLLFPCLDYMDNFSLLCRRCLLKRTDKCLIKQTKIDETRLVKSRVVASFLTYRGPVP